MLCFLVFFFSFSFLQDTFDIRILMAKSVKYTVNFLEAKEEDLYKYGVSNADFVLVYHSIMSLGFILKV